jgi:2-desacetyl-2-hydroxyethyl bacteriochlorophyllide A dehydrogenase
MLPTHTEKVVFRDTQAELVLQPVKEPGEKEILIRANRSLISPGTERAALTRIWDDPVFRENPGYALAGTVAAAGPGSGYAVGERVIALVSHARWALASAEPWVTLRIPEGVSDDDALFLPLGSVALHALRRARLDLGDAIVIIGLGLIGQIAVSLAQMHGARQVIAVDLLEDRLERARQRGAQAVVHAGREDAVERVMALTRGEGAPVIIDSTGNNQVIPRAFKMAAVGGRVVTVGIINEEVSFHFHREFMQRELSLLAASQPRCPTAPTPGWRWTQQANRQLLLEWMAAGKLEAASLISHRFPARKAPDVYQRLAVGDSSLLGIVLEWEGQEGSA